MEYTINKNEAFNSFEISFTEKPSDEVREALKALRYRWHSVKKIWYGYGTEEAVREAIENAKAGNVIPKAKKANKTAPKAEKVNKFGIKVGDVFTMSWGYEQTQADFFQVVALCGDSSVRVVDVNPDIIKTEPTCAMAEDRTYLIKSEPLPKASRSVFIKDQEKGDIKRVKASGYDNNPYINISDHYARKVEPGEYTTYVSWYY